MGKCVFSIAARLLFPSHQRLVVAGAEERRRNGEVKRRHVFISGECLPLCGDEGLNKKEWEEGGNNEEEAAITYLIE